MMYHNKVAAAIKVNGKILRERGDIVALPFGSEYSILIKNLNSVRIQVRVHIDGTDVTEGTWIVIQPNASVELERFIKNGNWNCGNRFKFIERTSSIEEFRGAKIDDGLVRIEYQTEQVEEVKTIVRTHYEDHYVPPCNPYPWERRRGRRWNDSPIRSFSSTLYKSSAPSGSSNSGSLNVNTSAVNFTEAPMSFCSSGVVVAGGEAAGAGIAEETSLDVGITVEGGISHQQFYPAAWFKTTGVTEVIVFHLKGKVGEKVVRSPITVEKKAKCKTCGRTNKAKNKFCANCGTALELV